VQHQRSEPLPTAIEDLRAVALPTQPPPPPERTEETVPVFDSASIQLAASPSPDSVVKLPAAPIPSDTVPPARAIPRFDLTPGAVKPSADIIEREPQHIFSRSEVDQRPIPIFRKNPDVSQAQINAMRKMRASFLMVAGIDGTVTSINLVDSCGNPEVDEACITALREWRFKPAIKKGREVRCWVQQNLIFKVTKTSPFEYREP
jgi:TonB family protein